MSVFRAFNDRRTWPDADGVPLSGGKLFTYLAGSSTKANTYTDSTGATPNSNPINLDSAGRPPHEIWLTGAVAYKFLLADSDATDPPTSSEWDEDNIRGIGDVTATIDEWLASGFTPTYVSSTSFTVPGDQTSVLTPGRALKIVDSGGTKYAWIKTSAYAALTTIVLDQNSDALGSPVSSVSYGILQGTDNASAPILPDTVPIRGGSSDRSKQVRLELDGLTTGVIRVVTVPDKDFTLGTTLATPQASTSGTSIDFTSIPSWVRRITILLSGMSTNGGSIPMIQLGDSGGFETTGYIGCGMAVVNAGASAGVNFSAGFLIGGAGSAAHVRSGLLILSLLDASLNTWVVNGVGGYSDGANSWLSGGSKSTSAVLDRVRLTTVGGTDTFDAGSVNIQFEP